MSIFEHDLYKTGDEVRESVLYELEWQEGVQPASLEMNLHDFCKNGWDKAAIVKIQALQISQRLDVSDDGAVMYVTRIR